MVQFELHQNKKKALCVSSSPFTNNAIKVTKPDECEPDFCLPKPFHWLDFNVVSVAVKGVLSQAIFDRQNAENWDVLFYYLLACLPEKQDFFYVDLWKSLTTGFQVKPLWEYQYPSWNNQYGYELCLRCNTKRPKLSKIQCQCDYHHAPNHS